MPVQEDSRGRIDISSATIATITNQAVHQCYGVVGMSSKNLVNGIAQLLSRDNRRGVEVEVEGAQIIIDVYVIVEYGVRPRASRTRLSFTLRRPWVCPSMPSMSTCRGYA